MWLLQILCTAQAHKGLIGICQLDHEVDSSLSHVQAVDPTQYTALSQLETKMIGNRKLTGASTQPVHCRLGNFAVRCGLVTGESLSIECHVII